MSKPVKANNPVGATEKTLRILTALKELDGAGVTELAQELDISKGTVHNHLATLEDHEYVVNEGGTYKLGLRFLELGEYTRQESRLLEIAKPKVDQLATQTGEIANLMIEQHGRGIYLYISRGEKAVNLDTTVGTRQYLHTSALGKSILSEMPEAQFEGVLQRHGLPAMTPNTVTTRDALEAELDEIRERGVAFDGEERAEGIRCVAAPITDNHGNLRGSVSVSGPSTRMKDDRFRSEIPEAVQNVATVIGIDASYSR
jgi:DNA-binding IclR family transcriptional regulator